MVENLDKVTIIDKKFTFVQRTKDKLIFKNIDKELEQLRILEIQVSPEEQRIKKVDIYTIEDEEVVTSLHVRKGIDGVTEIDYYPINSEMIEIDGKKEEYNLNMHVVYSQEDNNIYQELYELGLIKRGHKKHKVLKRLPVANNLFVTLDNTYHRISSSSISKLRQLTQFLIPSINAIENSIFDEKNENDYPQVSDTLDEMDNNTEELIETYSLDNNNEYPRELYIYDRIYHLIYIKKNSVVYRSEEDGIKEFEIYFSDEKDFIKEIRLIDYKESVVMDVRNKSKKKIIRLTKTYDNKIKATLCNREKESIILNGHTIDKTLLNATTKLSPDGKIEDLEVTLQNKLGNFNLKRLTDRGISLFDQNNEEYYLSSRSYITFKMLALYAPGIITGLEKDLINHTKEKEKVLLMRN